MGEGEKEKGLDEIIDDTYVVVVVVTPHAS